MTCPIRPHDRVVFIGDSVTHGHRRPEEIHDCYHLGCGYVKMIAAELRADRPELNLTIFNRGVCGNDLSHLEERWQEDCIDLQPTVVSVLTGVNDANPKIDQSLEQYESSYRGLLERTRAALPDVRFILLEPFGFMVSPPPELESITSDRVERVRQRQPIVKELADAFDACFVPLQSVFDEAIKRAPSEHWAADGVHPSAAGFLLIARQWLATVMNHDG